MRYFSYQANSLSFFIYSYTYQTVVENVIYRHEKWDNKEIAKKNIFRFISSHSNAEQSEDAAFMNEVYRQSLVCRAVVEFSFFVLLFYQFANRLIHVLTFFSLRLLLTHSFLSFTIFESNTTCCHFSLNAWGWAHTKLFRNSWKSECSKIKLKTW